MARPPIALLTDFGLRDHYVGTMKGVALGICPEATFVDISHEISPQDVLGGALELEASYRFFPPGTVFLVVIDPGVGSSRRAIAMDTGEFRFVGPDNGLFTLVTQPAATRVVELTNPRYARAAVSRTFEGRDRFAPAAAWMASGVDVSALGDPVHGLQILDVPQASLVGDGIVGAVVRVDRFGNLVTNIGRTMLDQIGRPEVRIEGTRADVVTTYVGVEPGGLCALVGSTERLEIAVSGGSAAQALGLGRGAIVRVRQTA